MKAATLEDVKQPGVKERLRALIIENAPEDVDLMLLALRDTGMLVEHVVVENREEFQQAIQNNMFDVILSDYRLPGWTGLDAFQATRDLNWDIPFLLVTGTMGEEAAVSCIKLGINDYILKDHISRLPLALKRALQEKASRDEAAKAQGALRISESRNRDLVENSAYGISRVSADGEFLYANAVFLRTLGCENLETLEAMNLVRDVFRFPEQYAQQAAVCRESGQVHGAEFEWRRRDGGLVTVRVNLRALALPENPGAVEVTCEDVTEIRAMERQLRQAQKFEAIGHLAGGIAHDFNNVVGAILGWAELGLDQSKDHPVISERFTRIREQADRAAALTRELLAFARRQVLQARPVDLNNITSGLMSFLDKVIGKDIEIKVLSTPLDAVKADPTQIEQVLMNLCINARDAMPTGGRLVIETQMVDLDDSYCRFYPNTTPGRYAVLCVSDTGMGMDAETRERIFEPFFTTKERGKGTGMGLATVYGIVKQHEGAIHVYSEPSHGTLFRVYLPAIAGAVADTRPEKPKTLSIAEMKGSETILLAEDHDSIREMARHSLTQLGYRVLAASNGEEALKLSQDEKPNIAILDIIMPKLGGPATAVKLTAQFPGLPILLTSGYSHDPEVLSNGPANMRFLQKPYSPTALACLVKEILNQAQQQQAAGC